MWTMITTNESPLSWKPRRVVYYSGKQHIHRVSKLQPSTFNNKRGKLLATNAKAQIPNSRLTYAIAITVG